MRQFEGTKTEENLRNAFDVGSQAANKYLFYAQRARTDGYEQIAQIYENTAHNESELAKIWFKLLNNNTIPTTEENLRASVAESNTMSNFMYKQYAEEALEDGFDSLAWRFERTIDIEKTHEDTFTKLLENVETGTVFKKEVDVIWVCRNCGYTFSGKEAPVFCPVCGFPQAYFQMKAENY